MTDEEKGAALLSRVRKFIEQHEISCPETIYQTDRVIEAAYEFIHSLCDVAGYVKIED